MDVLRARRDALRATISGSMTVLDALLRSQAATALDRQNVLDLILNDQVSLHKLDAQVQEDLKGEEFDADVFEAIGYDEHICALRTRVRFSASPDFTASSVHQPKAALFTTRIATSTSCSLPEEAWWAMVPGDVPPVREMTGGLVVEQEQDDKEGAARYNDAKEDAEGLSPRERLLRPPYPGVPVIAGMEFSQGPCQDLAVADATIVSETVQRPWLCSSSADKPQTSALETSQLHQMGAGVTDAIITSKTAIPLFHNPRIDDSTSTPDPPYRPCYELGIIDSTTTLEASLRSCCDRFVGDADLVSETFKQRCCDSQTVLLGPATKTRFLPEIDSLQGIPKRLLLRRCMSELRRRKRASAALVQARLGGDSFFSKRSSILDEPLYRFGSAESEVLGFALKTDTLVEHPHFFVGEVSDVDATALPSLSPDAGWKFGSLRQLFPFDPGGCLLAENVEHDLFPVDHRNIRDLHFQTLSHFDPATLQALIAHDAGYGLVLPSSNNN